MKDRGGLNVGLAVGCGLAGWLVPGLGHLLLGKRMKAGLFFSLIVGCFLTGYAVAEGTCVNKVDHPYSYYPQMGAGVLTLWLGDQDSSTARAGHQDEAHAGDPLSSDSYLRCVTCGRIAPHARNEVLKPCPECGGRKHKPVRNLYVAGLDLGLLYTMVAGLLNLLVAADAADRAR